MSILLSAEMEVDGDLKVTGTIQNDSLAQVIANLQAQITAMQAQINQLECLNSENIPSGYCDCFGNVLDACGDCGGNAVNEEECIIIMDMDGNEYLTVEIGEQRWMAENLRATLNNLGDSIEYSCYNENESNCQDQGALYKWYAISNNDVCPEGWSVPTDNDWKILEIYLGMDAGSANSEGWRGSDEGGKLKALTSWDEPNEGATNESGFTALSSGHMTHTGSYVGMGYAAYFWTFSIKETGTAYGRYLESSESKIGRGGWDIYDYKFSVRCIKD